MLLVVNKFFDELDFVMRYYWMCVKDMKLFYIYSSVLIIRIYICCVWYMCNICILFMLDL